WRCWRPAWGPACLPRRARAPSRSRQAMPPTPNLPKPLSLPRPTRPQPCSHGQKAIRCASCCAPMRRRRGPRRRHGRRPIGWGLALEARRALLAGRPTPRTVAARPTASMSWRSTAWARRCMPTSRSMGAYPAIGRDGPRRWQARRQEIHMSCRPSTCRACACASPANPIPLACCPAMTESPALATAPRDAARHEVFWLHTLYDLARLEPAFVRALSGEFDLALLAGRLCPVLLEGGQAAVFALHDYLHGDPIVEVERMVRARGYRLARTPRYALPAALLLPVA